MNRDERKLLRDLVASENDETDQWFFNCVLNNGVEDEEIEEEDSE